MKLFVIFINHIGQHFVIIVIEMKAKHPYLHCIDHIMKRMRAQRTETVSSVPEIKTL